MINLRRIMDDFGKKSLIGTAIIGYGLPALYNIMFGGDIIFGYYRGVFLVGSIIIMMRSAILRRILFVHFL